MSIQPIAFDQRKFLIRVYSVTLTVVFLYLILYQFLPTQPYKSYMLGGVAVILITGVLLTIKTLPIRVSSHYYIISCFSYLCFNTATSGGIRDPGIIWFLLCPIIAFLTLSSRVATFWLMMVLIAICSFYFLSDYKIVEEFRGRNYWYLVGHSLFFLTVYALIKIFRIEVSKKSKELEGLNKLLEEKQSILETSQEELISQRDHLREAEEVAVNRNKKTTGYLDRLIEISRMEELHSGNLEYAIQSIQGLLMRSMNLESVVIWHFDEDIKSFKLIGSVGTGMTVSEPSSLLQDGFQETLELLESGAIIVVPNDSTDPMQLRLQFQGLPPETSMIGCPYFIEGRFAGFFSCRASNRKWSPEDVLFVRAISDALPLAFRSHQRKKHQTLLEEKQRQIIELNESLEQMVSERTAELNLRNEQLLKFAFINAHNIRGPICRLQGLRNLLMLAQSNEEVFMLRDYLSASIEELDAITRKASKLLEDVPAPNDLKASVAELMTK